MDFLLDWYSDESISAIHHALRSSRRRLTIIIVADQALDIFAQYSSSAGESDIWTDRNEVQVTVRQLARKITSIEQEVPTEQATGESYHNVYTSLIQSHLPRLDAVGAIAYDPNRKTVRPNQNLLPLVIVTATTSSCQILFRSATADLYAGGLCSHGSSTD